MRWVSLLIVLGAGAADAKPSNPAFLGIQMRDLGGGGCMIEEITRGSGARSAGLQRGDLIRAIDGAAAPTCDAVLRTVQGHQPGDTVQITVRRGVRSMTVSADLVSRDEILRRRLVGRPIAATELLAVDDQRAIDLSELRGKTSIIGWFDVRTCDGCAQVFAKVAAWTRDHADDATFAPLAVTLGKREDAKALVPLGLDVPLAIADQAAFDDLTVPDRERINFMIIDGRGVVEYVAPIVPNGDDTAAAIDELFAAAEQASRKTK